MRTMLSAAALIVAAGLTAPALAQTTPIKPPDHQTSTQEMNKAVPQMKPGQPGGQGAAGGQGAGTSGTAGAGAAAPQPGQPGVAPEHQRSATEDMTRAVPTMKPGDQPAATGAAQGQGPGGWTADQKLRATDQKGAVEKPGPEGSPPATPPSR